MAKRSRDEEPLSPSTDTLSSSTPVTDQEDLEADHPAKVSALVAEVPSSQKTMQCTLAPHRHAIDFPSVEAFELHYAKEHTNRCSTCDKNFPSAHFLALHIDENHNPLREELQAKGEKTYSCFVEGCEKTCSTPQKRRLHLIDKHLFPKVYNFRVVDTGIDKSTSMLRESKTQRRRVSTTTGPADTAVRHRRISSLAHLNVSNTSTTQADKQHESQVDRSKHKEHNEGKKTASKAVQSSAEGKSGSEDLVADITKSMSALNFVPPSVTRSLGQKKLRQ